MRIMTWPEPPIRQRQHEKAVFDDAVVAAYEAGVCGHAGYPPDCPLCDDENVPGGPSESSPDALATGSGPIAQEDRALGSVGAYETLDNGMLDRRDRLRQLAIVCVEMFRATDRTASEEHL